MEKNPKAVSKEKVESILKQRFHLEEADAKNAALDIVERCFAITGVPTEQELVKYVEEYMDR